MSQAAAAPVALVLLPGFSLASLGLVVERFSAACGCAPRLFGVDEEMVTAAQGMRVQARLLPRGRREFHTLIACGGRSFGGVQAGALDRVAVSSGCWVGIGSGVLLLAQAGLLRDRHCSAPPDMRAALLQLDRQVMVSDRAITRDGRIWTCSGDEGVDTMLDLLLPAWNRRDGDTRPPCSEVEDRSTLAEARALMRNNLAEPLATAEIAAYLGVSNKKLERIFRRFVGQPPARFYIGLRLQLARQLLQHSDFSIEDIGRRCGFGSASHFSRAFRGHFGHSPRAERRQLAALPERAPAPWANHNHSLAG